MDPNIQNHLWFFRTWNLKITSKWKETSSFFHLHDLWFHPLIVPGSFQTRFVHSIFFPKSPLKGLRSWGDQESPIFSWDSNHKTCGSSVPSENAGHTSRGEKKIEVVHKPKNLISIANRCFIVAHEFSLDGFDLLLKLFLRFFHNPSSPRTAVAVIREVIRDALLWKLPPAKVGDGWRWGIPDGWLQGFPNWRFE